MTRTIVALYDDIYTSNHVVQRLIDAGYSRDRISLVARDSHGEYAGFVNELETMDPGAAAEGAEIGGGIGMILGGLAGLLAGLGALTIPGIGAVLVAGPFGAAISTLAGAGAGTLAGGVAGGLIGALVELGIPESDAAYYLEGVRRGGTLVIARVPDHKTEMAIEIMNNFEPANIEARVTEWRARGWQAFNPEGKALSEADLEKEQSRYDGPWEEDYLGAQDDTFDDYELGFRRHYQFDLPSPAYSYATYLPAYRYGYDLASDEQYRDREWQDVAPEARRTWEAGDHFPGAWEEFEAAVEHAWNDARSSARSLGGD